MESYSNSYKEAGVDVTKGYEAVKLMKQHVERTRVPGVADEIGGFGGMFIPNLTGISEPVLVSGTDGDNKLHSLHIQANSTTAKFFIKDLLFFIISLLNIF